jgi:uncharacterized protein
VAAADGLRPAIAEIPAIDQHAHLLAGPDLAVELADVLTESREPAQIEMVRDHPAYVAAQRELEAVGPLDAGALIEACRFEAMLVDDGFQFPGALSLEDHAARVGCPVHRIVRIETFAEAAADGWPPFPECREHFQQAITDAFVVGAVALKTIAAYRCGLDLPAPSLAAAQDAYDEWRRAASHRLTDAALVAQFVADALDATGRDVPLQVHTGLGDADQTLTKADPALLQPHIDHGMLTRRPVVLLHCYPFVRHAGYLASIYTDVHLDLSLAITLAPQRGPALVAEALELAPLAKLLFATDASRLPEMFFLGTRWWRESLARALGAIVDDGFADEARALDWAALILAGNARRLYRLD